MNRKEEYRQKLLDPRWQKRRLEILARDRFQCQNCGDCRSTLHVHHLTYKSGAEGPWDQADHDLVTLCAPCHELEAEDFKENVSCLFAFLADIGVRTSIDFVHLMDGAEQYLWNHANGCKRSECTADQFAYALALAIEGFPQFKDRRSAKGGDYF